MKKIILLTSLVFSCATVRMFAADPAPMPSFNIPASPATPAAQPQTHTASPQKEKHKTRKHKKHQKKAEQKAPEAK